MCQTYFSGLWVGTPPDQSYLRNRVVWCTKRTPGDERAFPRQFARHRMNLGRFQALGQRQRRQDGRQALCHHGLSTPRRPYHNDIMPAGRRDLKRPFHMLLAFHIRKVKIKLCLLGIKLSPRIYFGRHQAPFIIQKTNHFADMARSIYFKPVDHGCLTDVLPGHNQMLEAHFTSLDGYRQSPFHRLQTPVQTQLAEHHRTGQLVRPHLFVRRQDTDSQRQVISRSLLTDIRRSHIDHKLFRGETVSAVFYCRHNTLVALFYRIVRQANQKELDAP